MSVACHISAEDVKVIQVIALTTYRGDGSKLSPERQVYQYYALDGRLLAEFDTLRHYPDALIYSRVIANAAAHAPEADAESAIDPDPVNHAQTLINCLVELFAELGGEISRISPSDHPQVSAAKASAHELCLSMTNTVARVERIVQSIPTAGIKNLEECPLAQHGRQAAASRVSA